MLLKSYTFWFIVVLYLFTYNFLTIKHASRGRVTRQIHVGYLTKRKMQSDDNIHTSCQKMSSVYSAFLFLTGTLPDVPENDSE